MNKVRYGIIGIGKQGSRYASQLFAGMDKNAVLTAVCDRNEKRRSWAISKFGDKVKVFDTHEDLLDSGLIDALIIDTPHYEHPIIARKALERNINVLCDKPAGVYTKAGSRFSCSGILLHDIFNRCTKIINRYIRHLKRELTSKQQFIRQLHQT